MVTTKILLADDHPLVLMGIKSALEADGGFEVVGTARTGAEVLPLVARLHPDVVLLDGRLPKVDGLACLDRIRAQHPKVKVVLLSMFAEPERVESAFVRGASGYIVKSISASDLGPAIRQAVEGTAYHPSAFTATPSSDTAKSVGLTDRELTIVKAIARGLSNDAVAKELWITEQTVKFHLTNVYRKIGVTNRTEAARWTYAQGLIDDMAPESARTHSAA
jgi:DNA-binding NarL/FixJ family response regulator